LSYNTNPAENETPRAGRYTPAASKVVQCPRISHRVGLAGATPRRTVVGGRGWPAEVHGGGRLFGRPAGRRVGLGLGLPFDFRCSNFGPPGAVGVVWGAGRRWPEVGSRRRRCIRKVSHHDPGFRGRSPSTGWAGPVVGVAVNPSTAAGRSPALPPGPPAGGRTTGRSPGVTRRAPRWVSPRWPRVPVTPPTATRGLSARSCRTRGVCPKVSGVAAQDRAEEKGVARPGRTATRCPAGSAEQPTVTPPPPVGWRRHGPARCTAVLPVGLVAAGPTGASWVPSGPQVELGAAAVAG